MKHQLKIKGNTNIMTKMDPRQLPRVISVVTKMQTERMKLVEEIKQSTCVGCEEI